MIRVLQRHVIDSIKTLVRTSSNLQTKAGKLETRAPSFSKNGLPFDEIPGPFRVPIWGNLLQYKLGKNVFIYVLNFVFELIIF